MTMHEVIQENRKKLGLTLIMSFSAVIKSRREYAAWFS